MRLKYWAFIFLSPGFDSKTHTTVLSSPQCRFKTIGIDIHKKEEVIEIAKELVKEGVETIELCGGFGPIWAAKVSEAIHGAVPVGIVMYGPEARKPLLDIMT